MKRKQSFLFAAGFALLMGCNKLDELGNLVPKTADQDPSIPSITINNRVLHSEAFGEPDSTLIICLHGGPGADYRYMLTAKDLVAHGYRVVFYDQVGSGLSQRFDKNYYNNKNLDDLYFNDLTAIIRYYKTKPTQKIILFGHSWGAIMATAYAGKYPNAIDGMVLIEPGGIQWDDIVEYVKQAQSVPLWSEMASDVFYQDLFISTQKDNHEVLDYKMALLASHGSPNTLEKINSTDGFWRFGSVINIASFEYGEEFKPDMGIGIQNFQPPILFLYGGAGKVYTDEWANKISSPYKNKELFKIEGVGHSGMLEESAWTNITLPKILTYLNSL